MKNEIFILCPDPPERAGGVEACVREQVRGFQERGYVVRVWHRENSVSPFYRRNEHRMSHHITDTLAGYFIGRAAQKAMHPGVAAVISHSTVGWYPLHVPPGCKQFHLYHGTYRGQAEAIRPYISYLGYQKLRLWDSMVLERMSGRQKRVLCSSELTSLEVERLFGYRGVAVGYPLDMNHFRPLDKMESRKKLGLPQEGVIGAFVGSTQPTKGFPVVRHLAITLPDITWVFALRGLAASENNLGNSALMLNNVSRDQMPLLYSAADFSICPSLYDSYPYAVTEAIACGLPVISSLNGASYQYLREPPLDRLVIQDPNNIAGFIAAVTELASRPQFYRQAVLDQAQPAVEEWMKPENFWKRFGEITGLWGPDVVRANS
jgi:glycosyltransferase involved in cell wall biosynthesis